MALIYMRARFCLAQMISPLFKYDWLMLSKGSLALCMTKWAMGAYWISWFVCCTNFIS